MRHIINSKSCRNRVQGHSVRNTIAIIEHTLSAFLIYRFVPMEDEFGTCTNPQAICGGDENIAAHTNCQQQRPVSSSSLTLESRSNGFRQSL
ncbi:hypothetical protein OUZ56_001041 [Daphnia magna]|uniref:Uncharacterized protein n=1 Tax=Daphnia magna TaxID=35525 RepID=A0ABR0A1J0_9CRUS|nr:hypothetical protein OUZ56_001041 [Daphnia magna]